MRKYFTSIRNLTTNRVINTTSVRSTSTVSLELLKDRVLRINFDQWLPKRKLKRGRKGFTTKSLKTILLKLDKLLVGEGIFNHDELAIDGTDILSNHRNKHNPDKEAAFGYKSDGERFHGYWIVYVAGTASEMV